MSLVLIMPFISKVGMEKSIEHLRQPLGQLKEEIVVRILYHYILVYIYVTMTFAIVLRAELLSSFLENCSHISLALQ